MKLKNCSKNMYVVSDLKEAKSLEDRFLGLLKKSNPRSLMLKTRFGIHTLFLKNSIDVVVLDDKLKVRILKTLKPNSFLVYNPKYKIVIELPEKTIEKTSLEMGDKLKMLE